MQSIEQRDVQCFLPLCMKNWFRSWHSVTTVGAVGVQYLLKRQLSVVTIICLFFSFPKNLKTFSSQESSPKTGKIIRAKGFCIPMAWSFSLFIPSISALPSRCLVMFLLLSLSSSNWLLLAWGKACLVFRGFQTGFDFQAFGRFSGWATFVWLVVCFGFVTAFWRSLKSM